MAYNPNEPRDQQGRWSGSDNSKIESLAKASLKGSFAPHEIAALTSYSAGSSKINNVLRNKNVTLTNDIASTIAAMDSAFRKSFLPHEFEVYRVITQDFFDKLRFKIGVPLVDKGFLSTTLNIASTQNLVDAFNQDETGQRPVQNYKLVRLIVPKGHPAIPMTATTSIYADDKEILLKRGTRFKLLDRNNIKVLS